MINYLFIGGTYRGYILLSRLISKGLSPKIAFILLEDKHEVMQYSTKISVLLEKRGIKFFKRKKLKSEDYQLINEYSFDFGICCGWRTMININMINKGIVGGIIAAHDSLLPNYRGFAPVNWAIINGETKTGVTLFLLDQGIDTGKIFCQEKINIGPNDYAFDIYIKITELTVKAYFDFFAAFKKSAVKFYPQKEAKATYTCKRQPEDGRILWEQSSKKIFNLIKALAFPYPGAFCNYSGVIYHIRRANFGPNNSLKYVGRIPGRVISILPAGVEILCGEGSLLIMEWEDKKMKKISNPNLLINKISTTLS